MTYEKIESGMGFNEVYLDGEKAEILIETGDVFPDEDSREEYYGHNDEPVDWNVEFSEGLFRKLVHDEVTAYVSLDEEGEVDFVVAQYV